MNQKICDKCDNVDYYFIKVYVPLKGERWWCRECATGGK